MPILNWNGDKLCVGVRCIIYFGLLSCLSIASEAFCLSHRILPNTNYSPIKCAILYMFTKR